jgi:sugar phosphate isomerase/epimerase
MSALTADKLTEIYVKIRDARRELATRDEELKAQLDTVSEKLLEICKEQGASTIRTEYGTVSRRTTKRYWTSDWDSFFRFLKEHDAFSLMQHRINNNTMAQFLEENPELHPPGVQADASYTIVITKR